MRGRRRGRWQMIFSALPRRTDGHVSHARTYRETCGSVADRATSPATSPMNMQRLLTYLCLICLADSFLFPVPFHLVPVRLSSTSPASATESAPKDSPGFCAGPLRDAAMKLHTTDQAHKEGKQPAQKPTSSWSPSWSPSRSPSRVNYLQYLVDSLAVYEELERIVTTNALLTQFKNTGLERVMPLKNNVEFMVKEYSLAVPGLSSAATDYVAELKLLEGNVPAFVCECRSRRHIICQGWV